MYQIVGLDKSGASVYFNGLWQRRPELAGKWDWDYANRVINLAKGYTEITNITTQEIHD